MTTNEIRLQLASAETVIAAKLKERAALQAKIDAVDKAMRQQEDRRALLIAELEAKGN